MKIQYNNRTIEFTIEYRKRKTMEIKIAPHGIITVVAPNGTEERVVQESIKSKGDWILDQLKGIKERGYPMEGKRYEDGESFLYLGTLYPMGMIIDDHIKKDEVVLENNKFLIRAPNHERERLRKAMEKFYRKKCNKIIQQRVVYYQKYFKIKPKSIQITESKSIWGSCGGDRTMNFNWKLIMAPMEVVDYIVVHEMCHLVHMNHSKSFWTAVGKIMPDYKGRSEWLQYHGFKLNI